jgi:hypothetical protein
MRRSYRLSSATAHLSPPSTLKPTGFHVDRSVSISTGFLSLRVHKPPVNLQSPETITSFEPVVAQLSSLPYSASSSR